MAKYNIGDTVQLSGSNEIGTITQVYPKRPGRQLYDVVLESGNKKPVLESMLITVTNTDDAFECCEKGIYGSSSDFSCINTSYKIRNTNNNTISSLSASKTIFKAYQFKPLLKFLNSRNHRILIADEVGLGKTIEAGHIMLELSARRELKNALIICPNSLTEKWHEELIDKFGFNFKIYKELKDLVSDMDTMNGFVRGIVNYEKMREKNNSDFFELLDTSYRKFDFILCDEAHRLRNSNTKQYKGIAHLLESPCAAVFLTATPVMISQENLFNLLKLLDPEQYEEYSVFLNSLAINAPFISAINDLNHKVPFHTIKQRLEEAKVNTVYTIGNAFRNDYEDSFSIGERFKDTPLFQRIIQDLSSGDESVETIVRLQFALSSMSPMNNVFSRTRKKEITTDWTQAERDTHTVIVHLNEAERKAYEKVIDEYLGIDAENQNIYKDKILGLIQRKRQISSSVYGTLNDTENLKRGYDQFADQDDAKISELVKIIDAVKKDGQNHLIVFAVFKDTLRYLAIRLKKQGYDTIQIHGDIKSDERVMLLKQFHQTQNFSIMLSSEVGSEGLDMQFCNCMVNYDLPWNPMVVEQRIGRIDRFGQKSPKVHIYNLVVENSIQVDIYERLLDRIGIFKNCIGDLEAILDKDLEQKGLTNIQEWFNKLETELYCNKLTAEERIAKIDAIAKAIQTESRNLKEVTEGLDNTLTNDIYFQNEIDSIKSHNRYVTETEVINYVKLLIEKRLPACTLEKIDKDRSIYKIKLPQAKTNILTSFLQEFRPVGLGSDLEVMNSLFISKIIDLNDIPVTFNQDTAYSHPELEYISAYHPLMTSAYLFFEKNRKSLGKTFNFVLDKSRLMCKTADISEEYFLALYVINAEKHLFGSAQKIELLTPVLFDVKKECIVNDKQLTDLIFAFSQTDSGFSSTVANSTDSELILTMRIEMESKILELRKEYIDEQKIMIDTHKEMQMRQYKEYYEAQISHLNATMRRHQYEANYGTEAERRNAMKVLPMDQKNIDKKCKEMEDTFEQIQSTNIFEKEHKMVSLSHISII